ncbi:MAG: cob(I)yrinic acid a,c-diamide adenosyltransferase [Bacillota bacterium]|nr:cob(I)yrinic acid a,c-diamide adenosyltransferase [Bacillota bacterium]
MENKKCYGLTMVITGNGKGKTTSAFGQALRAIGHGNKVCIIQFMKGRKYGENLAAEKYLNDLTVIQCGLDSFVSKENPDKEDIDLAQQGLKKAKDIIESNKYYMIILDEINVAVDFNLIAEQDIIDIIKNKPKNLNLILTGRYASEKIKDMADLVSEVCEVKHHFNAGIEGQEGIEY